MFDAVKGTAEKDCRNCKHAGWDPDGNYCAAPKVLEKHSFGRSIKTTGGGFPLGVPEFCESPVFSLHEEKKDEKVVTS